MAGFWLAADGPPAARRAWGLRVLRRARGRAAGEGPDRRRADRVSDRRVGRVAARSGAASCPPAVDRRHAARRGAGRAVVLGGRARDTGLSRLLPDRRALEALHRTRLDRRPLRRGARVEARLDLAVLGRRRRAVVDRRDRLAGSRVAAPRDRVRARLADPLFRLRALLGAVAAACSSPRPATCSSRTCCRDCPRSRWCWGSSGRSRAKRAGPSTARRSARSPRAACSRSRSWPRWSRSTRGSTASSRSGRWCAPTRRKRADPRARLVYVGDEPVSAEF